MTYYGKAIDSRNPSNTVTTDIYFIEVRPFGREYRQGQQGGGGGGGGGGQQDDSAEALSKRQKEIIAATFKLIRDKDKFKTKEWTDNVHSVGASQTKLAEQTETLIGGLSRRGLATQDKNFKQLTENLKLAIEQMGPAAEQPEQGSAGSGAAVRRQGAAIPDARRSPLHRNSGDAGRWRRRWRRRSAERRRSRRSVRTGTRSEQEPV